MNKVMERQHRRNISLANIADANLKEMAEVPTWINNVTSLKSNNNDVETLMIKKTSLLNGLTTSKNLKRQAVFDAIIDNSNKVFAFAKFNNNMPLMETVEIKNYTLKRYSDEELRAFGLVILDKAKSNLAELSSYGITADSLMELENMLNDFRQAIVAPQMANNLAKDLLRQIYEKIDNSEEIVNNLNVAVEIVRFSNPPFYNTFKNMHKLPSPNTRTMSVKGFVVDAQTNEPLKNVSIIFNLVSSIKNPTKSVVGKLQVEKKSAEKGRFTIQSLASGTYSVTFRKEGYAELVLTACVCDGELTTIEAKMIKL